MEHRKRVTDAGEEESGTRQGEKRKTGRRSKEDVMGAELAAEKTSIRRQRGEKPPGVKLSLETSEASRLSRQPGGVIQVRAGV